MKIKHKRNPARNRSTFNHDDLPAPLHYYNSELGKLSGHGAWRMAQCPFHEDHTPSLSINLESGGFVCHACGTKGGDVLDFQRLRYGQSFIEAARELRDSKE